MTWMQDHRRIIHDLVIQKRATGLSPPEEEILEKLEAEELLNVRGNHVAPDCNCTPSIDSVCLGMKPRASRKGPVLTETGESEMPR